MMLPANPPLVSNSKMDNVFSTGTASAKFSCATDRESVCNISLTFFYYETLIYYKIVTFLD
jgi:hypothetical protein